MLHFRNCINRAPQEDRINQKKGFEGNIITETIGLKAYGLVDPEVAKTPQWKA